MAFGGGGDFALFAQGERAWIAYGSWDNGYRTGGIHAFFPPELNAGHQIAVQPLNAAFTGVDSSVVPRTVTGPDQEAPTLFSHGGLFYLLHGDVCCFCPQGSDAKIQVASDPMGNWTAVGNLNPHGPARIRAQSNAVIEIRQPDGSSRLIWTADLWHGARNGEKGSDFQFWTPLTFEEREVEGRLIATPTSVQWVDHFDVEIDSSPSTEQCDSAAGGS